MRKTIQTNGDAYIRLRATNSFGTSGWSVACQVRVELAAGEAPVWVLPTPDQRLIPHNLLLSVSVQPIEGATSYEWRVTNAAENSQWTNSSSIESFTTTQPTASLRYIQSGVIHAYVRSWKNNSFSGWSVRRFFRNPFSGNSSFPILGLPFNDAAPLSFPIFYRFTIATGTELQAQVTIATDMQFKNVVQQQSMVRLNGFGKTMLTGLQPNTQYYVRVQELSVSTISDYPPGALIEIVSGFRTGNGTLTGSGNL